MKIVFAGPSLPDAVAHARSVQVNEPALLGDIAKAVIRGVTVIGLVDGFFENVASVWHKEILYALSEGVQVYGAASMGALRAAECAPFGMIGVGEIFMHYATGRIIDDDAVAQVHGPVELDYIALSEPLVNIDATIEDLHLKRLITEAERDYLCSVARAMFFKERTYANVVVATTSIPPARKVEIARAIELNARNVKRADALILLEQVESAVDARVEPPTHWRFEQTQMWCRLLDRWKAELGARGDPVTAVA
jgi:hypothetical protein